MKNRIRILCIIFFLLWIKTSQCQPGLRPCNLGELFGFCNSEGKVIIPQVYRRTGPFQGNIGPVVREDDYWWFLDKNGNFLFNSRKWFDEIPLQPSKGLYKVAYFDPIFANVVEYYNKDGLPVKVISEDSLQADTIVYSIFNIKAGIARAKSKLGTPYGQDNLDCSGFLRFIYEPFGIILPYSAREIAEKGREVKPIEVKPGDLVFFSGSLKTDKTINHVGFVTSVKGLEIEFIHSSTSKGIVINKVSDSYYRERFLFARRIFG
jgi:hypothetical protein